MSCTFSVVTPTYNGASTLHRVYDSLCRQTFDDFQWIVVDDGSTDDTRVMIEHYMETASFPVIYHWQENAHKKVAVNRGVNLAEGEFVLVADNDDEIPDAALEILIRHWLAIPEESRGRFAGITGLCVDEKGALIGDPFPYSGMVSTDLEMRVVHGVRGEKWGAKRTEVMRRFPYPEDIPGYVPEGLVWSRIDRMFKTLYVNEVVRVYYLERQRAKIKIRGEEARRKCAGRLFTVREALQDHFSIYRTAPSELLKLAINYWRYSLHSGNGFLGTITGVSGGWQKLVVVSVFVPALVVYWKDRCG